MGFSRILGTGQNPIGLKRITTAYDGLFFDFYIVNEIKNLFLENISNSPFTIQFVIYTAHFHFIWEYSYLKINFASSFGSTPNLKLTKSRMVATQDLAIKNRE
jgi:hypothetical protein